MAPVPASPAAETMGQRVARLLAVWREQTAYLSSSSQLTGHPAYQELMALGPAAVPYVLRDLAQTGDGHLSKALSVLTSAHPVPDEDRGRIRGIAETWLRWASTATSDNEN